MQSRFTSGRELSMQSGQRRIAGRTHEPGKAAAIPQRCKPRFTCHTGIIQISGLTRGQGMYP